MCFDLDSRPPIAPIAGGALDSSWLMLTAGDGNRFARVPGARPSDPTGAGDRDPARRPRPPPVLRGARPAVRGARRSTRWRIDYFGRTRRRRAARRRRSTTCRTSAQTTWAGIAADIAAAVERSGARRRRGRRRAVFTIGFCMGGRMSFLAGHARARPGGRHRLLRHARRPVAQRRAGPGRRRRPDRGAGPRAVRRRRRGITARGDRRRSTRALTAAGVDHRLRDLPGRAAQLLRPQGGRVRRRQRGGLGRDVSRSSGAHAAARRAPSGPGDDPGAGVARLDDARPGRAGRRRPAAADERGLDPGDARPSSR